MKSLSAFPQTHWCKSVLTLILALGLYFFPASKSQAASGNDNFANATLLTGSTGTASGSNVGYTKETGEPNHAGNTGGASAWYYWTAPISGLATIDTFGSSFDTLLAVYTGNSVSGLTEVVSDDDAGGTVQSQVQFSAVKGVTYMIAVDGYLGDSGSITLNYSFPVPVVVALSASPSNAGTVIGSGTFGAGSTQEISATANSGWIFSQWSDGDLNNPRTITVTEGNSSYTAVFSQVATLSVLATPSNGGTVSGSGTFAVSSSQQISATANSGWFFLAWNDGNTQNPRTVTVPVSGTSYTATFQVISNDNNDNFSNSLGLTGTTGYVIDSNVGFTKEIGEPNHAGNLGGTSAWYSWTAPTSGWVTFDTTRSTFDTLLAIYTGTSVNALSVSGSNDDSSSTARPSLVAFNAVAGTTYKVAVDGFNGASGTIFLNYQPATLVPVTVQANPAIGGAVAGSGTYAVGATIQISGSVNPGYIFTGWEDGDARIARSVTVPSGGATYTANFLKTTGSNDSFSGAQLLSGSFGVLSGTTTGYTKQVGEPNHAGNAGGASAWFTWTAPVTGPATFDTIGSNFDTLLAVYTGASVGSLTSVASNNDADSNTRQSRVTFSAVAGTTYKIAVDGYNGASGNLTLNFQQLQAVLTVVANPVAGGNITGSGTFAVGYSQTITASPKTGYLFNGWNDGNTQTSRSVTVPVGGATYTANFVISGTINVTATPLAGGTAFGAGIYGAGTSQKIGITVNPGYLFTGWNDGVVQNPRVVSTGTGSVTYTGTLAAAAALNVQASPANGGTIVGSGTYVVGTSQQIGAAANTGWIFLGWSDGSFQNPRTVSVVSSGTTYTADFGQLFNDNNDAFASALVLNNYSGTVTDSNVGYTKEPGEPSHAGVSGTSSAWYSWTAPSSGLTTFNTFGSSFDTTLAVYTGTSVNSLTQVASNDDASGTTRQSQVSFSAIAGTTYKIAVDAVGQTGIIVLNYSESAGLTLVANPSNGGTVAGSGTFAVGASEQIRATANSGWIFTEWNDGNTDNPRTISVAGGGSTYTANFSQLATISLNANPTIGGTASGAGTFIVGTTQQISATANDGYTFTGWSDNNTDNPRSVTVALSGSSYTANFSPINSVNVVGTPSRGGSVAGSGSFIIGSNQVISATANPGWVFTRWNDGDTSNPRTIVVPYSAVTYTANFSELAALNVQANPANAGAVVGSGTFIVGSSHPLTATPYPGWKFIGWIGGGANVTQNPLAVTVPSGGTTRTAQFAPTTGEWKGSYYGIFDSRATGSLVLKINPLGSFTASMNIGGIIYSAHSVFDLNGNCSTPFGKSPYILKLAMGTTRGEVHAVLYLTSDPNPIASFDVIQSMFDAKGTPALYQGSYTFILQPDPKDLPAPKGNGYGTLTVSKTGAISLNGKLADGTSFLQSSALTKNATLPLYSVVRKVPTPDWFVIGLLRFENNQDTDIDGVLKWSKPVQFTDKVYPWGIHTSVEFLGSKFTPGVALFPEFTSANVSLQRGDLTSLFDGKLVLFLGNNKLGAVSKNLSLILSQNPKTGVLTGNLSGMLNGIGGPFNPTIQGVILQKTNTGAGFFIDDLGQSAPFELEIP